MEVQVSSTVIDELLTLAVAAQPREACGLMLGAESRVETILPTRNVHPTPETHFEIDPQALVDAYRAARGGGPEVVGYYHSHPLGPPVPSATDRALASGDGKVWAIVGEGTVGWWRDAPGGFEPLSYRVTGR